MEDLEKKVDELVEFRDSYFVSNKSATTENHILDVRNKAFELIKDILPLTVNAPRNCSRELFACGKILSLCVTYEEKAEQLLSDGLKIAPSNADGWTDLALVLMEKPDLEYASLCLKKSIELKRSAKALYLLASIIRVQMNDMPSEKAEENEKKRQEAQRLAEEAISIDPELGPAYNVLGSGHLLEYFATVQTRQEHLNAALAAYRKSLSLDKMYRQPDVHLNISTAMRYNLDFGGAFHHLLEAIRFDPYNAVANQRLRYLTDYLTTIHENITKKGSVRPKRLEVLFSDKNLKQYRKPDPLFPLSAFSLGHNKGKVLLVVVTGTVQRNDDFPLTVIVCDQDQSFFVLTVFNCVSSFGFVIGDVLTIVAPQLFEIENLEVSAGVVLSSVTVVRALFPGQIRRNGQPIGMKQVGAVSCTTKFSEPPGKTETEEKSVKEEKGNRLFDFEFNF